MKDLLGIGGLVVLAVALVAAGPLLGIWALNTLFGFAIPFTLNTWFATLCLESVFYSHKGSSK